MPKEPKINVRVVRITLGDDARERWCTIDIYGRIASACLGKPEKAFAGHDKPHECSLLSDAFHDYLRAMFGRNKRNRPLLVVIDFSSVPSTAEWYSDYCDDLCREVQHRLDRLRNNLPHTIDFIIVVSDLDEFLKSVTLRERLVKSCEDKNVGLVIAEVSTTLRGTVKHASARIACDCVEKIGQLRQPVESGASDVMDEDFIESLVDEVFGHFEVSPLSGDPQRVQSHVTSLVSLERCLQEDRVIPFLHGLLTHELGEGFVIAPVGLQGPDLDGVAMGIVNNDIDRFGVDRGLQNRKVALLCDILWHAYDLDTIIASCYERGASDVFTLGFAAYKGFSSKFRVKAFVDIDGHEYKPGKSSCPFCFHDVKPTGGEYLQGYLAEIEEFHPFVFWELVSSTEGAFLDGHWPSPRTKYHYLHRVRCEPLFRKHGYGIAIRIRNLLTRHVYAEWIDTLLCPDEPEATLLAEQIIRSLKTSYKQLVVIPRRYFTGVTGTSIPVGLSDFLTEKYGNNPLDRRNVIIVDQAAHHFGTLSALSHICRFLGGRILAFAVAVDRLSATTLLSDCLPNSHYLSLYRWPCPPFKPDQCPCAYKQS